MVHSLLKEIYCHSLEVNPPWEINSIVFEKDLCSVNIHLSHPANAKFPCKSCYQQCPVYDHLAPRTVKHLNTCQMETFLILTTPRINCKEHGIKAVWPDFIAPKSGFTMHYETFLFNMYKILGVNGAKKISGLTWDKCCGVVARGSRLLPKI